LRGVLERVMAKKPKKGADEAGEGADGQAPAKKGLPIKLIAIGVAGLAVVGGGGWFGYTKFVKKPAEKVAEAQAPVVKPPAFFDLPDMMINLATQGDRQQYLRMKIVIEVADEQVKSQLQPVMPRVVDAFQSHLRELRPTDLQGSAGLFRLREELTRRVNVAVAPTRINAVLFKEIVIQ
jgi:flagellar FliL protein